MSFFKALGETVKDTASTIGAKSKDVLEIGKLKLQRNKLESVIKERSLKLEIQFMKIINVMQRLIQISS
jgi:hypothetical protein